MRTAATGLGTGTDDDNDDDDDDDDDNDDDDGDNRSRTAWGPDDQRIPYGTIVGTPYDELIFAGGPLARACRYRTDL